MLRMENEITWYFCGQFFDWRQHNSTIENKESRPQSIAAQDARHPKDAYTGAQ